jgi:alpha-beta hydrolase superfamily lysophospholipase
MGTSTGGSLAVWAAAREPWRSDVLALVVVSPNFGLKDRGSRMLLWPWGAYLAQAVLGKERCFTPASEQEARHWTTCYPTEALLPMTALAERAWTLDLSAVTAPVLVLYSSDDQVVDPIRTERRFASFGGEPKALVLVEGSGDRSSHVIAGDVMSPETNDLVVDTIAGFLEPVVARAEAP